MAACAAEHGLVDLTEPERRGLPEVPHHSDTVIREQGHLVQAFIGSPTSALGPLERTRMAESGKEDVLYSGGRQRYFVRFTRTEGDRALELSSQKHAAVGSRQGRASLVAASATETPGPTQLA